MLTNPSPHQRLANLPVGRIGFHELIHVLGFIQAFDIADIKELSLYLNNLVFD
ncbi:MAG: hypothetical protein M0Q21_05250 [Ignavibacteriaceae bacterium]|nr:hypothetical protein [Ignavibacteriaceae bacterium]